MESTENPSAKVAEQVLISSITSRLTGFRQELADLTSHPDRVQLIAVTKYASDAQVQAAYAAGLRQFGESRVQAYAERLARLPQAVATGAQWHFIGHLQRNKMNKLLETATTLLHSVDSLPLARAINQRLAERYDTASPQTPGQKLNILVQVNQAQEASKNGLPPDELEKTVGAILALPYIHVRGLMAMAPAWDDLAPTEAQASRLRLFTAVHEQAAQLKAHLALGATDVLTELSMGMSSDWREAVRCGSTMVRLGAYFFNT